MKRKEGQAWCALIISWLVNWSEQVAGHVSPSLFSLSLNWRLGWDLFMAGHKAAFESGGLPALIILIVAFHYTSFFAPLQQGLWTKPSVWRGAVKPKNGRTSKEKELLTLPTIRRSYYLSAITLKASQNVILECYIRQPSNIIQTAFLSIWYAIDGRTLLEKSAIVSHSVYITDSVCLPGCHVLVYMACLGVFGLWVGSDSLWACSRCLQPSIM